LVPHLKNKDSEGRQDRKSKYKNNRCKNKKKSKAMQIMWSAESDGNDTDGSSVELRDEKELNLALTTRVEEGPSTIDIDIHCQQEYLGQ
jgi:hypothetical protein